MELRNHGKKILSVLIAGAIFIGIGIVIGANLNFYKSYDKYGIVVDTKIEEFLENGTRVWHDPIDEDFANKVGYWNLTNPDRYVLEAMQTHKMVLVSPDASDLTIVKQLEEHNWKPLVRYNGKYYLIDVYGSPMHPWM